MSVRNLLHRLREDAIVDLQARLTVADNDLMVMEFRGQDATTDYAIRNVQRSFIRLGLEILL